MKVAVVTGASGGIGFEIIKALILEYKIRVIAISGHIEKFNDLLPSDYLIPIAYNINLPLEPLIDIIASEKLKINYLINNAGLLIHKPFKEFNLHEAEEMFKVNYFIPSELIRFLLPFFDQTGISHIVNISSMGGVQGSQKYSGLSHYSASKAAIACLTEYLAAELPDSNIHINALSLGAVQTKMLETAFPGYKAPVSASEMGKFIADFTVNCGSLINGKIIPVSLSDPK